MTDKSYAPSDDFVRRAVLLKVVDGDTLRLRVDLGWATWITQDVRLCGLDTPEPRGDERAAGRWVTKAVEKWIDDAKNVLIRSNKFEVGSFGRCLCEVWIGGQSLNEWLIRRGYAWVADHNGDVIGERDVEALAIPEEVKQDVRETLAGGRG